VTPDIELAGAHEATARVRALVDRTAYLSAPSLLPGWSRAHVVAHLAGNARSHVRMLQGTVEGTIKDQYPGGDAGRAADIEDLAARPADAVAALHSSAEELDALWQVADWDGLVRTLHGSPQPAHGLAWGRWREVEVHAVDLDAGYRPQDWPEPFLERLLAELLARTDLPALDGVSGPPHALAAWLSGRSAGDGLSGDLPVLPEWR
jgi:maleylpyruvate isomerase